MNAVSVMVSMAGLSVVGSGITLLMILGALERIATALERMAARE